MHIIVQSKCIKFLKFLTNMNLSSYIFLISIPSVFISLIIFFELIGNNS